MRKLQTLAVTLTLLVSLSLQAAEAPAVPEWEPNLPEAQKTEQGTLLPPELSQAVLRRLLFLDQYPKLCQDALDANDRAWADSVKQVEEENEPESQLTLILSIAAGALAIGLGAGIYLGAGINR